MSVTHRDAWTVIPRTDAADGPNTPYTPPGRNKHMWPILALAIVVVLLAAGSALAMTNLSAGAGDRAQQEQIAEVVHELQSDVTLPHPIDGVTTWVAIRADPDAVHLFYEVDASYPSSRLTARDLRTKIRPAACSLAAVQHALQDEIPLRFTYQFDDTNQRLNVTFSKDDCQ